MLISCQEKLCGLLPCLACCCLLTALWTGCDLFTGGDKPKPAIPAQVVWSHPLSIDQVNATQPHLDGKYTYVAADRMISCYELDSGTLRWQTPLGIDRGIIGRKVLGDEAAIYINSDYFQVKALDKATGDLLWENTLPGFSPIGRAVLAQNATHLFLGGYGEVVRIDKDNGEIDLRIPITQLQPEGIRQGAHSPLLRDGMLYVAAGYYVEGRRHTDGNILAYDAQTGAFLWGYQIPVRTQPVPGYDDVFEIDAAPRALALSAEHVAFTAGQAIYVLDRATGQLRWDHFYEDQGFDITMLLDEDVFYVGTLTGEMIAFDLETRRERWRRNVGSAIITLLTIREDKLYFEVGGKIWVLDKQTGEVIWSDYPPEFSPSNSFATYIAPVAVGEDRMVAVGVQQVYGLTRP